MKLKTLLIVLWMLAGVLQAAPRPNILYFYVDDMGWGSIGPNAQAARKAAGKPYVLTPNLDRLAAEGVNFTRGYGCHVCSPARSSQQTGFHQGHTFADRNDPDNAKKAMRKDDWLMGDVLSAAGYATGYWGKWGYGGSKDQESPVIQNVQTLPTSHGYEHVLTELHHVRAHTFFQPTLWHAPAKPGAIGGLELVPNSMAGYRDQPAYPAAPALQNHPKYPKTAYCDDAYAFAALDFVRNQAKQYTETKKPFFGLLAVQIPHAPFDEVATLPNWDKAYRGFDGFKDLQPQAKQWAAMVTRIDAHFGNILAALDEAGVADHTLVIFQSDNGGPGGANNSAFDANGGLRGTKGSIQEGGIRVPLVMRWPAVMKSDVPNYAGLRAGANSDRVVDVTDLLPTFCELAGAPAPLGTDGVSIAPTLMGSGHQRHRAFIIHEAGNGQSIIRGKHKLVRSTAKGKGKGKRKDPAAAPKPSLALYDLEADPAETKNIAKEQPALAKDLQALLLGERVAEPKGFATTYHHWTGADGAALSDAANWSDYVYENAGITYMTDAGAPRLSWIAKLGQAGRTARGDAAIAVLALEIGQTLRLDAGVGLEGRNEIRISDQGHLVMQGGTVSSLRWVDLYAGGRLSGTGVIEATVYNRGSIATPGLRVHGDYIESAGAAVELSLDEPHVLRVRGDAHLAGTLSLAGTYRRGRGGESPVLAAGRVHGTFANPDNLVTDGDGKQLRIQYSRHAVSLVPVE